MRKHKEKIKPNPIFKSIQKCMDCKNPTKTPAATGKMIRSISDIFAGKTPAFTIYNCNNDCKYNYKYSGADSEK